MNDDFRDMLDALLECGARFLVVGAHALAVHGIPRATGDMDIWIDRDPGNCERVWQAIIRFGVAVESLEVTQEDLARPDVVVQIGLPPRRIDIITDLTGVDFASAWADQVGVAVGDLEVPFLGRASLIQNKRATGRLKDLADLEALGEKP